MNWLNSKVTVVVASVILIVAGISIWRSLRPTHRDFDARPLKRFGQVLAEQTAATLRNQGQIVVVLRPEHQQDDQPLHLEWDAFQRELTKHPGITISVTEIVPPDPADPQLDPLSCPLAAFKRILEQHENADAILFFTGLPGADWVRGRQVLPPGPIKAKILAFGGALGTQLQYAPYFERDLDLTLILKGTGAAGYEIITGQNLSSLPQ